MTLRLNLTNTMEESKRNIAILGSTGSIGTQTLDIISENPGLFKASVLTAARNWELLATQARKFLPSVVVIAREEFLAPLREALSDLPIKAFGNAKEVKINNGIKVRYDLISINNTFVSVWFIGQMDISKYNQELRNLRIYLSKLHAYKEATRVILDYLKYNPINVLDMHRVITYFKYILSLIDREVYYGYNNTDFWRIVFDVDNTYNNVSWNDYKQYMNAIIQGVASMNPKNNIINITGDGNNIGAIVNDSTNVQVNSEKQNTMEENIKNFDDIFDELLKSSQLTKQQIESLNEQVNNFMEYIKTKSPEKGFASKLLSSLKTTFNCMINNSDSIQKLIVTGESIISFLK